MTRTLPATVGPGWSQRVPLPVWVLVCATLWGSAFPVIKLAYAHWAVAGIEIERSLFAGVRFIAAGGVLLLIAKQPGAEWRATPTGLILAMAATQTVGQYVCFYLGLSWAGGTLSSLLVSSGSFWWMLLAPVALKTPPPTAKQWGVLLIGAVGLTLAVYAPGDAGTHPRMGGLLVLAASFFGALGLAAYQKVGHTMGSRAGTGFSLSLGGLVLGGLGVAAWDNLGQLFDGYIVGLTAWLAFVSAAAFSLWNWLSTIFPVPLLATYRFLIPLCGMAESLILLHGEHVTVAMGLGTGLVVVAMLVAGRVKPKTS